MRERDRRARMGILDMIGLATVLIFAVPAGLLGVQFLLDGRTFLGGVLVVVAALMVLLQRAVTTPGDVPAKLLGTALGTAVKEPDESAGERRRDDGGDGTGDEEAGTTERRRERSGGR